MARLAQMVRTLSIRIGILAVPACAKNGSSVMWWDIETGRAVRDLPFSGVACFFTMAESPDGRHFIAGATACSRSGTSPGEARSRR
jgi:hypothetical protein